MIVEFVLLPAVVLAGATKLTNMLAPGLMYLFGKRAMDQHLRKDAGIEPGTETVTMPLQCGPDEGDLFVLTHEDLGRVTWATREQAPGQSSWDLPEYREVIRKLEEMGRRLGHQEQTGSAAT